MPQTALAGLRVLEIGQHIAVPYCAKLLGDLGADVIKIERPGGDPLRHYGPFPNDLPDPEKSALFHYLNVNKRGAVMDLAREQDRARALELAADADEAARKRPPAQGRRLVAPHQQGRGRPIDDRHEHEIDGDRRPLVERGIISGQEFGFSRAHRDALCAKHK